MRGIEVVNDGEYYPLAHKWCLEKKLTMLGNSDVHGPTNLNHDFCEGEHRTMTLVLAKERSMKAIKEALRQRRTVVYYKNILIGEEKYLRAIFDASIEIINPDVAVESGERFHVQIRNRSEIDFELVVDSGVDEFRVPAELKLYGGKTVLFSIRAKSEELSGNKNIRLPYKVKNLWTAPEQALAVGLNVNAKFVRSAED
jgi:hypothetical protein